MMINKKKVVIIDWSIIVHRSIFAWKNNQAIPSTYTGLSILISSLKKIGIKKNDIVIIALDSTEGNWRKKVLKEYKADRKEKREKQKEIDWNYHFSQFNTLLADLDLATPFYNIYCKNLEADDIAAVATKFYQEKEDVSKIIHCSYDHDWELLWDYPKVKIYSFLKKYKSVKGSYKIKPPNFNAYALLAKMINKEASDNLTEEILSEQSYDKRLLCVDLLNPPDFVEQAVLEKIKNLKPKENYNLEQLPFETLRNRFSQIYDPKFKITYEDVVKYEEKKKNRKKRKKRRVKK